MNSLATAKLREKGWRPMKNREGGVGSAALGGSPAAKGRNSAIAQNPRGCLRTCRWRRLVLSQHGMKACGDGVGAGFAGVRIDVEAARPSKAASPPGLRWPAAGYGPGGVLPAVN